MPGRNFTASNYRYDFNGKESDKQSGWNTQDYGFRNYDPRLGRFFSQDPLFRLFPFYSPYHFAGNKPIAATDLDGREDIYFMTSFLSKIGKTSLELLDATDMGSKFFDDFIRTYPKDGDIGNQGWDIFTVATAASGGGSFRIDLDEPMPSLDEDGRANSEIKVSPREKLLQARKEGSGVYYNHFKKMFGDEIWNSAEFEKSLNNGRKIIIVEIGTDFFMDTDLFSFNKRSQHYAYEIGHEFMAHALRISRGINDGQDHLIFNGISGGGTLIGKNTPAHELGIEIENVNKFDTGNKSRLNSLINIKFQIKPKAQLRSKF